MKWFIADLHFDADHVAKHRTGGLLNADEWSCFYSNIINDKVKSGDILYLLGDFSEKLEKHRQMLKGYRVVLIRGNHDPSVAKCKRFFGQNGVFDSQMIKIKEHSVFLSHYPHLCWPKSHYGSLHLYGHVHDKRTKFWNEIPELADRKALDVSPESYYNLYGSYGVFSEDQILSLLSHKKGHDDIQWYVDNFGKFEK